jgi:hypothetical protein
VGRERLIRLSDIAGWELKVTSLQLGPAAHPLSVVLETAWTTMLQSCLNV